MVRYFFEISYYGGNHHGWQSQKNASSIQEQVTWSLQKVLRKNLSIVGSSRTDSGVHALQQFFHLDSPFCITEKEVVIKKLNSMLSGDIAIKSIRKVLLTAHARHTAKKRSYVYKITLQKSPFLQNYAYHLLKTVDIKIMNVATQHLIGKKDFESFAKMGSDTPHYICHVTQAYWEQQGTLLTFHITANRFLRGMVRAIVGTLLNVGTKQTDIEDFLQILASKDRTNAGMNVPPQGLYLTEVAYPQEIFVE